jgi:hypothetical protein
MNLYPLSFLRMSIMTGKGYFFLLMHRFNARRSDTHLTRPSFFGVMNVAPLRCTTSVMRWIALLPLRGLLCTSLDEKRGVWQKRETLLGKSTPFSAPNG